jgi:RNA-binding protein
MTAPAPNPVSLSGAQRRALRALGHHLDAVLQIGQRGITDSVVDAAVEALTRHELIKISVGRESPVDRQEGPVALARLTGSHVAQVLGRTALLYRRRFDDPAVELPGVVEEGPRPLAPTVLSADPRAGKAAPGKAAPGKAAPRAAAPRTSGKAAPRTAAPGKAAPRTAAPRTAASGKTFPGAGGPKNTPRPAAPRSPARGRGRPGGDR